ncbi:MAG: GNAT family N-acetyltransferase [Oscillospiraceae bacterium]|nr:GNAT family N-acetyltransferase [Oscillospiraceae bacterium]
MDIRFAKPEDVGGILSLLKQVGRVHHEGRPDIFRSNAQKYGASQVIAMLDSSKTPIFVAVHGGKVVGYGFCIIKAHKNDPVIADHTELYIDDLCVEETCRGQHIGKAIYEEILRYAKMRKCYNVTLNVWSCNENAMAFYKSLGMLPQKVGMETILEK